MLGVSVFVIYCSLKQITNVMICLYYVASNIIQPNIYKNIQFYYRLPLSVCVIYVLNLLLTEIIQEIKEVFHAHISEKLRFEMQFIVREQFYHLLKPSLEECQKFRQLWINNATEKAQRLVSNVLITGVIFRLCFLHCKLQLPYRRALDLIDRSID